MTKTILLIEDDPAVLKVMTWALEENGYATSSVSDAESAREIINSETDFALVLIDYWLDRQDCVPLLDQLQKRRPKLPVILVTGGNDRVPIEAAHAIAEISGITEFLQKPFEREQLLSVVRTYATPS